PGNVAADDVPSDTRPAQNLDQPLSRPPYGARQGRLYPPHVEHLAHPSSSPSCAWVMARSLALASNSAERSASRCSGLMLSIGSTTVAWATRTGPPPAPVISVLTVLGHTPMWRPTSSLALSATAKLPSASAASPMSITSRMILSCVRSYRTANLACSFSIHART